MQSCFITARRIRSACGIAAMHVYNYSLWQVLQLVSGNIYAWIHMQGIIMATASIYILSIHVYILWHVHCVPHKGMMSI